MISGSDTKGFLRIFPVLIVFLIIAAPISASGGRYRLSSKSKVKVIVIDPGHGGKDRGVVGPRGAIEKNITLTVAIQLKVELEERFGHRVVLTRLSDRFVSIKERRELANREMGDCLVSLHVNGYFTKNAKGIRSYYLPFDEDEARKEWNEKETSKGSTKRGPYQTGENETVDIILKDLKRTEWINEGGRLSRVIGAELARLPGIRDVEISQIRAPILMGAEMPACLVELGFITNPSEEKRLRDRSYIKGLSKALARGIMTFFQ